MLNLTPATLGLVHTILSHDCCTCATDTQRIRINRISPSHNCHCWQIGTEFCPQLSNAEIETASSLSLHPYLWHAPCSRAPSRRRSSDILARSYTRIQFSVFKLCSIRNPYCFYTAVHNRASRSEVLMPLYNSSTTFSYCCSTLPGTFFYPKKCS